MKITTDSHVDHGISSEILGWIRERYADLDGFRLETVEIPEGLPPVPCGLHGPAMGDPPVEDGDVTMAVRGERSGPSRLCQRPPRMVRKLTVIAGPHEGEIILYTAFGGPAAPREPWDPGLDDAGRAESSAFWAEHALSEPPTFVAYGDVGAHNGEVRQLLPGDTYQSAQPWAHCSTVLCEGTEDECQRALDAWLLCDDPRCYTTGIPGIASL